MLRAEAPETYSLQQIEGYGSTLSLWHTSKAHRQFHVGGDGEPREEVGILEEHRCCCTTGQLGPTFSGGVDLAGTVGTHGDDTGRRPFESGDQIEQC